MVLSDLVERIRGEDLESPGLRLTPPQAARMWNLHPRACDLLLQHLTEDGLLAGTSEGSAVRTDRRARRRGASSLPAERVAR